MALDTVPPPLPPCACFWRSCLPALSQVEDDVVQLTACNGMGNCSFKMEDYKAAVDWNEKALKLSESVQDSHMQELAALLIGNAYFHLGELDTAFEYYGRGLAHAQENCSRVAICRAYCCVGNTWYGKKVCWGRVGSPEETGTRRTVT